MMQIAEGAQDQAGPSATGAANAGATADGPTEGYMSVTGQGAVPKSYDVKPGLLKRTRYGYAGNLVMAGLAEIEQVKTAKLPHTWYEAIEPHEIFGYGDSSFSHGISGCMSGVQLLLTDALSSAPGLMAENREGTYDDNFPTTGNNALDGGPYPAQNNPYGGVQWKNGGVRSYDFHPNMGIPYPKYLNCLNFPIATKQERVVQASIDSGGQHHPAVYTTQRPDGKGSGHAGCRLRNFVSGPKVHVDKIHLEITVEMNNLLGHGEANQAIPAFQTQVFQGLGCQNLDFRVLVIQNTDSYFEKYGCHPHLWKDLLNHPMGNPMEGIVPSAEHLSVVHTNTDNPIVNNMPITGWPLVDWNRDSNIAPTVEAGLANKHQVDIPNQNYSAIRYAPKTDGTAKRPYGEGQDPQLIDDNASMNHLQPRPRDIMNVGINRHAYRVLHDEKFSLGASAGVMTNNSNLPREKTIVMDFPVNGSIDIGSQNADGMIIGDSNHQHTLGNYRTRTYGFDARNIYQNAPRVLIMACPQGGRSYSHIATIGSGVTSALGGGFNTKYMWNVSTRGYTVYRDTPTPNVNHAFANTLV
jgi:hypothetical protein